MAQTAADSGTDRGGISSQRQPLGRPVRLWLWGLCVLLVVMVLLGGATRLTDSGLSMVQWQPFTLLPPLDHAAWQETFARYQQSPQYRLVNQGMSLADFQGIFWLEYIHRLWGRMIGLAVLGPLLVFAWKGWLPAWLRWRMGGLFVLGGLQGGLGWVMVASGLKDQPWVSPYRLAAHLGLAVLLYGALVLTALRASGCGASGSGVRGGGVRGGGVRGGGAKGGRRSGYARACLGSAGLVFVTILSGAFVAGLDAGFTYNTFPLMDGRWIPAGWASLSPWWRNLFETIPAVQFNHRLLAIVTACCLLGLALWGWRRAASPMLRGLALAVGVMVCIQVALGITTLLLVVPVGLGVAHQGGALILWSLVLALGAQADSDLGKVESA